MTFLVRETNDTAGEWEEREGDLGLGGISWVGKTAATGEGVDVRFRLPGVARELRARGEILRVKAEDGRLLFQLRFVELDLENERAIAKHLDDLLLAQR